MSEETKEGVRHPETALRGPQDDQTTAKSPEVQQQRAFLMESQHCESGDSDSSMERPIDFNKSKRVRRPNPAVSSCGSVSRSVTPPRRSLKKTWNKKEEYPCVVLTEGLPGLMAVLGPEMADAAARNSPQGS